MFGPDPKILLALISAFASLLVALVSYFSTRANQRNVERLKAELNEKQAERNALRDYEYEARKRLYHECGPLIFQLLEQAEGVINRVYNLARTASQGDLDPGRTWLARNYYRLSTYYRFLAPLATLKLLQSRLTVVDMSLDSHLFSQYLLAKQIYYSFADDFDLARASVPRLEYKPHAEQTESKGADSPAVYAQQGVPIGILDNAVQSLLLKEEGAWRVMTFAEFEKNWNDQQSQVHQAFNRISYLFTDFHPRIRPVLWRLLIVQASLYRILLQLRNEQSFDSSFATLIHFPQEERLRLDWRGSKEQAEDAAVLQQPFDAAEKYLREQLKKNVTEKLPPRSSSTS
jgi:hypothetical protein